MFFIKFILLTDTHAAEDDGNDNGECRECCTGHKDVDIGIFMSQTADTEQGDYSTVMR